MNSELFLFAISCIPCKYSCVAGIAPPPPKTGSDIEIGSGFNSGAKFGSEIHDEIEWNGKKYTRSSNNAGGIEGGMSNTFFGEWPKIKLQ